VDRLDFDSWGTDLASSERQALPLSPATWPGMWRRFLVDGPVGSCGYRKN